MKTILKPTYVVIFFLKMQHVFISAAYILKFIYYE